MTPEQFCYWLQGYVEIRESTPTPAEWLIITEHLKLVFKKETPQFPRLNPPIFPNGSPPLIC